jgi:hypothetical protein
MSRLSIDSALAMPDEEHGRSSGLYPDERRIIEGGQTWLWK